MSLLTDFDNSLNPRVDDYDEQELLAAAKTRFRLPPRLLNLASIVLVFAIWELIGRFVVTKRLFFVPISTVAVDFWDWVSTGQIFPQLETSAKEFAFGFGLAIVAGLILGLAMGLSRVVNQLLDPIVAAFNATPLLALTPLFIIWFGIGIESKVMMILFLATFPILINTATGIREVDRGHVEAVRSFGANWLQLTMKVRLPSALAFIIAGLRLGMARALVGIFVVELFGSQSGIGYSIANAATIFDTKRIFSGILILSGTGVLFSVLLTKLENTVAPWRRQRDQGGL